MQSQPYISTQGLQAAIAAVPSLFVLFLFTFSSSAQAQNAEPCQLLTDPNVTSLISGPGESALRARCGEIVVPQISEIQEPVPEELQPEATDNILVNNRAADKGNAFTQSETSVARFNNTLVAGFNDSGSFATTGDFTGYARSTNGGNTWIDMGAPKTPLNNVRAVFGDPVLRMDRRLIGSVRTYFANLGEAVNPAGQSIIAVHRSDNFGTTWRQAGNASPRAAANQFQDKEWLAVDTRLANVPGAGNVYVCWTRFGGAGGIQFSRSTNGGVSFTQLGANLSSSGTNVQGCTIGVDPRNGRVYVAWSDFTRNAVRMRISNNFGASFGTEFTVGSLLPFAETTTSCGSSGVRAVFLDSEAGATTRAIRSIPFPNLAVNPKNGHVYVTWHRGGTPNNPNIAFARSTTGAAGTYSTKNIVTTARAQFFPSVAVNRNGKVTVMYYSTEKSSTNRLIDTFAIQSNDGVNFGVPSRLTDVSFDRARTNPNADPIVAACYMGDYNDVEVAVNRNEFNYIWGDNRLQRTALSVPDPDVRFKSKN